MSGRPVAKRTRGHSLSAATEVRDQSVFEEEAAAMLVFDFSAGFSAVAVALVVDDAEALDAPSADAPLPLDPVLTELFVFLP
jgi:hypothetical protein